MIIVCWEMRPNLRSNLNSMQSLRRLQIDMAMGTMILATACTPQYAQRVIFLENHNMQDTLLSERPSRGGSAAQ